MCCLIQVYDAGKYLCWFKYAVEGEQNESPTYLTYLTPADEEGLKAANPEKLVYNTYDITKIRFSSQILSKLLLHVIL